ASYPEPMELNLGCRGMDDTLYVADMNMGGTGFRLLGMDLSLHKFTLIAKWQGVNSDNARLQFYHSVKDPSINLRQSTIRVLQSNRIDPSEYCSRIELPLLLRWGWIALAPTSLAPISIP
ncbi:hypothetical protein L0F63_002045, partial [Massospora cicadina]